MRPVATLFAAAFLGVAMSEMSDEVDANEHDGRHAEKPSNEVLAHVFLQSKVKECEGYECQWPAARRKFRFEL